MEQARKPSCPATGTATEPTATLHQPDFAARAPAESAAACLTRREVECLGWCAEGKSYWETATILGIAERTVSFHMEAVRGKLKATSNAHAVALAVRAALLETGATPRQGLR
jgi:DNA-binding CsgD family transcriptional regulator